MRAEKRPTIHDVARHAGVSAATVSKIMNGVKTVKPNNVERVQEVIRKLGYRADPVASELRQGQRRLIAAIVPELENSFFGALVSGIEKAAEKAGYKVIFATSRESEAREIEVVQRMHDWRVAGAIVVPVHSELGGGASKLKDLDIPSVLVDRVSPSSTYDTVAADNYKASSNVADFLAEQGHKYFLLHCATTISQAIKSRADGFTSRLSEIDKSIQVDKLLSEDDVVDERDKLRQYFDDRGDGDRPTAIFSLSQRSTLIALSELRRRKLAIPEQIALVGFDDADWMQTTWPSITTVSQPVERIAEQAVRTLLARLNENVKTFPVQHLEQCELQIRESTQLDTVRGISQSSKDK
ncbi:MAG: LacI family DNA-binding transcriptional regulator [Hyphomicrobiales bacterium]